MERRGLSMVDMNFLCPNGDRGIFVHVGLREILVQDMSFGGNVELNFPPPSNVLLFDTSCYLLGVAAHESSGDHIILVATSR